MLAYVGDILLLRLLADWQHEHGVALPRVAFAEALDLTNRGLLRYAEKPPAESFAEMQGRYFVFSCSVGPNEYYPGLPAFARAYTVLVTGSMESTSVADLQVVKGPIIDPLAAVPHQCLFVHYLSATGAPLEWALCDADVLQQVVAPHCFPEDGLRSGLAMVVFAAYLRDGKRYGLQTKHALYISGAALTFRVIKRHE